MYALHELLLKNIRSFLGPEPLEGYQMDLLKSYYVVGLEQMSSFRARTSMGILGLGRPVTKISSAYSLHTVQFQEPVL